MIPLAVVRKFDKVGIISCSGEAVAEGTLSRLACRRVLDVLRPAATVTICLPLFIAGGQEERDFARDYPTITVDGCEKRCASKGTEKLSAKPSRAILVPDILSKHGLARPTSLRNLTPEERAAVEVVAAEIARAVDEVLAG